jgi:hypothetical protein
MTAHEDQRRPWRWAMPRPRPPLTVRLTEGVWTLVAGLAFMYMLAWVAWIELKRRFT